MHTNDCETLVDGHKRAAPSIKQTIDSFLMALFLHKPANSHRSQVPLRSNKIYGSLNWRSINAELAGFIDEA